MPDLMAAERTALIELHDWDELLFGGFICLHCTSDDPNSLDDPTMWPCHDLRAAGMTDKEALQIISDYRAKRDAEFAAKAGAR